METLLLNADGQPIKIINWKRAILLYIEERAYVLKLKDMFVRSQFLKIQVPDVMILNKYIKPKVRKIKSITKNLIFCRDKHTCAYCGEVFLPHDLSLDHIFPKSRGGKKTYYNIITACNNCNNKKRNRTPKEACMPLLYEIKDFNYDQSIFKHKISVMYPKWKEYCC